jgi:hypothetical protein
MALQGAGASFRLLQASGLGALRSSGGASGWLRGVHSNSANMAAEPAPAEQPEEPRWSRELGVIRTDWT